MTDDQGEHSLAVELVTPCISSPLLSRAEGEARDPELMMEPHARYAQTWKRGYMIVDMDRERAQAAWFHYE